MKILKNTICGNTTLNSEDFINWHLAAKGLAELSSLKPSEVIKIKQFSGVSCAMYLTITFKVGSGEVLNQASFRNWVTKKSFGYFAWNTGLLIGILIMVDYNPYINGSYNPRYNPTNPCFFHCSTDIWVFPLFRVGSLSHDICSPVIESKWTTQNLEWLRRWSVKSIPLAWSLLVNFEMRSLASSINFQHWWAIVGEWHHCTSAWAIWRCHFVNVHKSWRTERLGSEVGPWTAHEWPLSMGICALP